MMKTTKMRCAAAIGAAVLSLCAGVQAAGAAIFTITYTGVVSAVKYNIGGIFGAGDLLNQAFTAVYRYDSALGVLSTYAPPGNDFYGQYLRNGASSPLIGGGVTINGATYVFDGLNGSALVAYYPSTPPAGAVSSSIGSTATRSTFSGGVIDSVAVALASREMGAPATFEDFTTTEPGFITFPDTSYFQVTRGLVDYSIRTELGLSIKQVAIAVERPAGPTGGVPEPGTWALMIAGFAVTGGALRRRAAAFAAR